ncbi:oligosaccharide flippase family protein [uncultured Phascolarctobacterium sp.]|uniref:oligosaccharide flippase family protein n=1 Tax=uncultured Phascolarctobacterium sp. TaxID=512296 RepID=UPI0025CDC80F|nr:oligosaccharide flippase family protein [uncultured Phascolarctobacterium sp.]
MNFNDTVIKRCFDAIFYGVGGAIGSRILMVLANIIVSRILGVENFGQYSFINNTVNLFITFSGLGLSATLVRYISANKDNKIIQGIYIKTLGGFCIALSFVFSAFLFILSSYISYYVCETNELSSYFRIVSVSIFFASMANIEQSIMIGFEQFKVSSLIQIIRCSLFLLLSLIMTLKWKLMGAIYAMSFTYILLYFISLMINTSYYKKEKIILKYSWDEDIKKSIINFSIPSFGSSIFVVPVNWVCNAMLTNSCGFMEIAYFTIAQQWMTYITYIPSQMGQLRPIYTDLLINKQINKLKRITIKTTLITTGIALVVALVLSAFSDLILNLYGKGYLEGKATFIVMLFTAVLYTMQVQTGFIIQAAGKMWLGFLINGIWGISLLLFFKMFIAYNSLGYSIAYLNSYILVFLLQYYVYKKIISAYSINN